MKHRFLAYKTLTKIWIWQLSRIISYQRNVFDAGHRQWRQPNWSSRLVKLPQVWYRIQEEETPKYNHSDLTGFKCLVTNAPWRPHILCWCRNQQRGKCLPRSTLDFIHKVIPMSSVFHLYRTDPTTRTHHQSRSREGTRVSQLGGETVNIPSTFQLSNLRFSTSDPQTELNQWLQTNPCSCPVHHRLRSQPTMFHGGGQSWPS